MFASNNRASKYMKQILIELKEVIDISIIIAANFNIHISVINGTSRKKNQ